MSDFCLVFYYIKLHEQQIQGATSPASVFIPIQITLE